MPHAPATLASSAALFAFLLACVFQGAAGDTIHVAEDEKTGVQWIGEASLTSGTYTLTFSKVAGYYAQGAVGVFVYKAHAGWEDEFQMLRKDVDDVFEAQQLGCSPGFVLPQDSEEGRDDDIENHDHDSEQAEDHHRRDGVTSHNHFEDTNPTSICQQQGAHILVADASRFFVVEMDQSAARTLVAVGLPEEGTYLFFAQRAPYELEGNDAWLVSSSGQQVVIRDIEGGTECSAGLSTTDVWLYSMGATGIGAATSLVGVLLLLPVLRDQIESVLHYLNSLASGVLLSLAIVHLTPEAISLAGAGNEWKASVCVLAGFVAAALLEHVIHLKPWARRTAQVEEPPAVNVEGALQIGDGASAGSMAVDLEGGKESGLACKKLDDAGRALVLHIVFGDMFHNFFDGVVIALAFRVCGPGLGWTVTAGSIVHELPQEISDCVLMVKAGLSVPKALLLNVLSSLSSLVGVCVVIPIGEMTSQLQMSMGLVLGLGAGVLMYIAVGLIPSIIAVRNLRTASCCWMVFALGAVAVGLTLLQHIHCNCEDGNASGGHAH